MVLLTLLWSAVTPCIEASELRQLLLNFKLQLSRQQLLGCLALPEQLCGAAMVWMLPELCDSVATSLAQPHNTSMTLDLPSTQPACCVAQCLQAVLGSM
jgi:hypothetical protein